MLAIFCIANNKKNKRESGGALIAEASRRLSCFCYQIGWLEMMVKLRTGRCVVGEVFSVSSQHQL